jgi:hypothetical protein
MGDRVGHRRASAAGPSDRMAYDCARGCHLRFVDPGDLFWRELPWPALAAAGAWIIAWQMNLQHEVIHGPSDAEPFGERRHRHMAALALAAFFDLSHDPSASSSGRQSEGPVRGSGKLLPDFGRMARPRGLRPRDGAGPIDAAGPRRSWPRLDDCGNRRGDVSRRERQAGRPRDALLALRRVRPGARLDRRRLRHAGLGSMSPVSSIPA